jgi:hypothetical protein
MRRFNKNDKINAAVAGFLCGLSMLIDTKSRRILIALVFLSRAFDTLLNMLDVRGIFKKFSYGEFIPWVFAATFNKYCMSYEPECLNNGFRKFYLKAAAMTYNDIKLTEVWAKMLKDGKPC